VSIASLTSSHSSHPTRHSANKPASNLENAHLLLTQHLLPNRLLEPKLALHLHPTVIATNTTNSQSSVDFRLRPSLLLGRLRNSVFSVLGIPVLLLTITLGAGLFRLFPTPIPRSRRSRRSPSSASGFLLWSPGLRRRVVVVVVVVVAGLEGGGEGAVSIPLRRGSQFVRFLCFLSMGRLRFEIRMDVNGWGTQGIAQDSLDP
jgi:hypothetical protein